MRLGRLLHLNIGTPREKSTRSCLNIATLFSSQTRRPSLLLDTATGISHGATHSNRNRGCDHCGPPRCWLHCRTKRGGSANGAGDSTFESCRALARLAIAKRRDGKFLFTNVRLGYSPECLDRCSFRGFLLGPLCPTTPIPLLLSPGVLLSPPNPPHM